MNETVEETRVDEGISLDDYPYEAFWQEESEPEPERPKLRREALILLITFLLPTLLILLEVLTGGVTPLVHSAKTALPHLLPAVHF